MASGSVGGKTSAPPMSNTPDSALPVHPTGLVQKGYQVSCASSTVFQIKVALKIVGDVVGISPGEGRADGAHHLLRGLCVQTRYVFLQCGFCEAHLAAERTGERVLGLTRCQGRLPSEIQVAVGPCQYALHWMCRCVPWSGGSRLPTATAQVVIIADEALESSAPKVSLHTRVTGDPLVTRHDDRAQRDFVLPGDVGWAGGETPGTQGLCPSIDPAPLQVFSLKKCYQA